MKTYKYSTIDFRKGITALVAEGFHPLSYMDILQRRTSLSSSSVIEAYQLEPYPIVNNPNSNPHLNHKIINFDDPIITSDCFMYHPDGRIKPVVHNSKHMKEIRLESRIHLNTFILPDSAFEQNDAPEYNLWDLPNINGRYTYTSHAQLRFDKIPLFYNHETETPESLARDTLTRIKNDFLTNPIPMQLAKGDKNLLEIYLDKILTTLKSMNHVESDNLDTIRAFAECLKIDFGELRGIRVPIMIPWVIPTFGAQIYAGLKRVNTRETMSDFNDGLIVAVKE